MSWRDRISEQGKFRGARFYYEKVEGEIGRRTILKEYPGKDVKPRVEDLGLATRKFTIDMFVLGEDYDRDRDALRRALETAGSGELEHPYWGKMQVQLAAPARVTESSKEGRIARFTVTFIEAGDDLFLLSRKDTKIALLDATGALRASILSRFAKVFSLVNAITKVVQEVTNAVNEVASAVNTIRGKIAAVLAVIDGAAAAITAVTSGIAALVLAPAQLARSLDNMIATVVAGVNNIGQAFEDVLDFFGGTDALPAEGSVIENRARVAAMATTVSSLLALPDAMPPAPTGEAQQQELSRANQDEIRRLIQAASICAAVENAVELTYESFDQAQDMATRILALVDALLSDDDLGDETYGPLADLRASTVEHFNTVAKSLPELADYTPQQTTPALVAAYQFYGDSTREIDVLLLNPQLRDPTAVPGGQIIKVLTDG